MNEDVSFRKILAKELRDGFPYLLMAVLTFAFLLLQIAQHPEYGEREWPAYWTGVSLLFLFVMSYGQPTLLKIASSLVVASIGCVILYVSFTLHSAEVFLIVYCVVHLGLYQALYPHVFKSLSSVFKRSQPAK